MVPKLPSLSLSADPKSQPMVMTCLRHALAGYMKGARDMVHLACYLSLCFFFLIGQQC
jgi:hypothetical protein